VRVGGATYYWVALPTDATCMIIAAARVGTTIPFSAWFILFDRGALAILRVVIEVTVDLEINARTAVSMAFSRSCKPGSGPPCWAHSLAV